MQTALEDRNEVATEGYRSLDHPELAAQPIAFLQQLGLLIQASRAPLGLEERGPH